MICLSWSTALQLAAASCALCIFIAAAQGPPLDNPPVPLSEVIPVDTGSEWQFYIAETGQSMSITGPAAMRAMKPLISEDQSVVVVCDPDASAGAGSLYFRHRETQNNWQSTQLDVSGAEAMGNCTPDSAATPCYAFGPNKHTVLVAWPGAGGGAGQLRAVHRVDSAFSVSYVNGSTGDGLGAGGLALTQNGMHVAVRSRRLDVGSPASIQAYRVTPAGSLLHMWTFNNGSVGKGPIAWAPGDRPMLATIDISYDSGKGRLLVLGEQGEVLLSYLGETAGDMDDAQLYWSPDGGAIAVGMPMFDHQGVSNAGRSIVYRTKDWTEPMANFASSSYGGNVAEDRWPQRCAWSPDGKAVACASEVMDDGQADAGMVRVIWLEDGTTRATMSNSVLNAQYGYTLHWNYYQNQYLLLVGVKETNGNHSLATYQAYPYQWVTYGQSFVGKPGVLFDVAQVWTCGPGFMLLSSGSAPRLIFISDSRVQEFTGLTRSTDLPIRHFCFNDDIGGLHLPSYGSTGAFMLYSVTNNFNSVITGAAAGSIDFVSVKLSRDKSKLALGMPLQAVGPNSGRGEVQLIDLTAGLVTLTYVVVDPVEDVANLSWPTAMTWAPDSQQIAIATNVGTVYTGGSFKLVKWDGSTLEERYSFGEFGSDTNFGDYMGPSDWHPSSAYFVVRLPGSGVGAGSIRVLPLAGENFTTPLTALSALYTTAGVVQSYPGRGPAQWHPTKPLYMYASCPSTEQPVLGGFQVIGGTVTDFAWSSADSACISQLHWSAGDSNTIAIVMPSMTVGAIPAAGQVSLLVVRPNAPGGAFRQRMDVAGSMAHERFGLLPVHWQDSILVVDGLSKFHALSCDNPARSYGSITCFGSKWSSLGGSLALCPYYAMTTACRAVSMLGGRSPNQVYIGQTAPIGASSPLSPSGAAWLGNFHAQLLPLDVHAAGCLQFTHIDTRNVTLVCGTQSNDVLGGGEIQLSHSGDMLALHSPFSGQFGSVLLLANRGSWLEVVDWHLGLVAEDQLGLGQGGWVADDSAYFVASPQSSDGGAGRGKVSLLQADASAGWTSLGEYTPSLNYTQLGDAGLFVHPTQTIAVALQTLGGGTNANAGSLFCIEQDGPGLALCGQNISLPASAQLGLGAHAEWSDDGQFFAVLSPSAQMGGLVGGLLILSMSQGDLTWNLTHLAPVSNDFVGSRMAWMPSTGWLAIAAPMKDTLAADGGELQFWRPSSGLGPVAFTSSTASGHFSGLLARNWAWTADGSLLAVASPNLSRIDVYRMDAVSVSALGTVSPPASDGPLQFGDGVLEWSPDGTVLIAISTQYNASNVGAVHKIDVGASSVSLVSTELGPAPRTWQKRAGIQWADSEWMVVRYSTDATLANAVRVYRVQFGQELELFGEFVSPPGRYAGPVTAAHGWEVHRAVRTPHVIVAVSTQLDVAGMLLWFNVALKMAAPLAMLGNQPGDFDHLEISFSPDYQRAIVTSPSANGGAGAAYGVSLPADKPGSLDAILTGLNDPNFGADQLGSGGVLWAPTSQAASIYSPQAAYQGTAGGGRVDVIAWESSGWAQTAQVHGYSVAADAHVGSIVGSDDWSPDGSMLLVQTPPDRGDPGMVACYLQYETNVNCQQSQYSGANNISTGQWIAPAVFATWYLQGAGLFLTTSAPHSEQNGYPEFYAVSGVSTGDIDASAYVSVNANMTHCALVMPGWNVSNVPDAGRVLLFECSTPQVGSAHFFGGPGQHLGVHGVTWRGKDVEIDMRGSAAPSSCSQATPDWQSEGCLPGYKLLHWLKDSCSPWTRQAACSRCSSSTNICWTFDSPPATPPGPLPATSNYTLSLENDGTQLAICSADICNWVQAAPAGYGGAVWLPDSSMMVAGGPRYGAGLCVPGAFVVTYLSSTSQSSAIVQPSGSCAGYAGGELAVLLADQQSWVLPVPTDDTAGLIDNGCLYATPLGAGPDWQALVSVCGAEQFGLLGSGGVFASTHVGVLAAVSPRQGSSGTLRLYQVNSSAIVETAAWSPPGGSFDNDVMQLWPDTIGLLVHNLTGNDLPSAVIYHIDSATSYSIYAFPGQTPLPGQMPGSPGGLVWLSAPLYGGHGRLLAVSLTTYTEVYAINASQPADLADCRLSYSPQQSYVAVCCPNWQAGTYQQAGRVELWYLGAGSPIRVAFATGNAAGEQLCGASESQKQAFWAAEDSHFAVISPQRTVSTSQQAGQMLAWSLAGASATLYTHSPGATAFGRWGSGGFKLVESGNVAVVVSPDTGMGQIAVIVLPPGQGSSVGLVQSMQEQGSLQYVTVNSPEHEGYPGVHFVLGSVGPEAFSSQTIFLMPFMVSTSWTVSSSFIPRNAPDALTDPELLLTPSGYCMGLALPRWHISGASFEGLVIMMRVDPGVDLQPLGTYLAKAAHEVTSDVQVIEDPMGQGCVLGLANYTHAAPSTEKGAVLYWPAHGSGLMQPILTRDVPADQKPSEFGLAWSRDGQYIAFNSTATAGQTYPSVAVWRRNSSNLFEPWQNILPTELAVDKPLSVRAHGSWSPDSVSLFIEQPEAATAGIVSVLYGSMQVSWLNRTGQLGWGSGQVLWNADSTLLVLSSQGILGASGDYLGSLDIIRVNKGLQQAERVVIIDPDQISSVSFQWSPVTWLTSQVLSISDVGYHDAQCVNGQGSSSLIQCLGSYAAADVSCSDHAIAQGCAVCGSSSPDVCIGIPAAVPSMTPLPSASSSITPLPSVTPSSSAQSSVDATSYPTASPSRGAAAASWSAFPTAAATPTQFPTSSVANTPLPTRSPASTPTRTPAPTGTPTPSSTPEPSVAPVAASKVPSPSAVPVKLYPAADTVSGAAVLPASPVASLGWSAVISSSDGKISALCAASWCNARVVSSTPVTQVVNGRRVASVRYSFALTLNGTSLTPGEWVTKLAVSGTGRGQSVSATVVVDLTIQAARVAVAFAGHDLIAAVGYTSETSLSITNVGQVPTELTLSVLQAPASVLGAFHRGVLRVNGTGEMRSVQRVNLAVGQKLLVQGIAPGQSLQPLREGLYAAELRVEGAAQLVPPSDADAVLSSTVGQLGLLWGLRASSLYVYPRQQQRILSPGAATTLPTYMYTLRSALPVSVDMQHTASSAWAELRAGSAGARRIISSGTAPVNVYRAVWATADLMGVNATIDAGEWATSALQATAFTAGSAATVHPSDVRAVVLPTTVSAAKTHWAWNNATALPSAQSWSVEHAVPIALRLADAGGFPSEAFAGQGLELALVEAETGTTHAAAVLSTPAGQAAARAGALHAKSLGAFLVRSSLGGTDVPASNGVAMDVLLSMVRARCNAAAYEVARDDGLACVCAPGAGRNLTSGVAGACVPCEAGTSSHEVASFGDRLCSACPAGTFAPPGLSRSCYSCPIGARCTGGKLKVMDGYYLDRYSSWSEPGKLKLHACIRASQCQAPAQAQVDIALAASVHSSSSSSSAVRMLQQTSNTSTRCTAGSTGPVCGSCLPGYATSSKGCVECTGSSAAGMTGLGLVAAGVLAALAWLAFSLHRDLRSMARTAAGVATPGRAESDKLALVRVALNWLQTYAVIALIPIIQPAGFRSSARAGGALGELSPLSMDSVQCALAMPWVQRWWYSLSAMWALLVAMPVLTVAVVALWRAVRPARMHSGVTLKGLYSALVVMLYTVLFGPMMKLLLEPLDEYSEVVDGVTVLRADTAVVVTGNAEVAAIRVITFTLLGIWLAVIPGVLFGLLWKHRQAVRAAKLPSFAVAASAASSAAQESSSTQLSVIVQATAPLYGSYRVEGSGVIFESTVILRKAVMVCSVLLIPGDGYAQAWLLTMVFFIAAAVTIFVKPFRQHSVNIMEFVTLAVLTGTVPALSSYSARVQEQSLLMSASVAEAQAQMTYADASGSLDNVNTPALVYALVLAVAHVGAVGGFIWFWIQGCQRRPSKHHARVASCADDSMAKQTELVDDHMTMFRTMDHIPTEDFSQHTPVHVGEVRSE